MAKVFLVNARGVSAPSDHLDIYLTAYNRPSRASFEKLKRQLKAKWPVDDVQLRGAPLRLRNPLDPHTIHLMAGLIAQEIYVHFSSSIQTTAALVVIANAVRDWWKRSAKVSKSAKPKKRKGSSKKKPQKRKHQLSSASRR